MDWERIRHGLGIAGVALLVAAGLTVGTFVAFRFLWLFWEGSGF